MSPVKNACGQERFKCQRLTTQLAAATVQGSQKAAAAAAGQRASAGESVKAFILYPQHCVSRQNLCALRKKARFFAVGSEDPHFDRDVLRSHEIKRNLRYEA